MSTKIKFEVVKFIKILSIKPNGWSKEVNIIKWNNGPKKLDIRSWSPDNSKMGKGITLTLEEAQLLKEAIKEI